MQPVLHSERLHLKPLRRGDAAALHRIWGDPEVIWWGHLENLERTAAFIAELEQRRTSWPVGTGWWLLIHRDEGTVVGDAILQPVPRPTGEIEVGWHLAREHWGGGYATEAGGRLVRHGLETLGLGVIIADIAVQNERSIAVAGRIGMTRRPTAIVRLGFVHGVWEIKR